MKKLLSFIIVFMLSSCSGALDYSIAVSNQGEAEIWFYDVELYKEKDKSVKLGAGILIPTATKKTLSYRKEPNSPLTLVWKNEKTGKKDSASVALKLPLKFWKDLIHNEIIISIDPENNTAKVSYSGYSVKDDKDYYIDSEGKPFTPPQNKK